MIEEWIYIIILLVVVHFYSTRKHFTQPKTVTTRWPKCVFQRMIDVTAYNSFILWCEMTGNMNAKRGQFLKMLGAELCGGEVDEKWNIKLIQAQPCSGTASYCRRSIVMQ